MLSKYSQEVDKWCRGRPVLRGIHWPPQKNHIKKSITLDLIQCRASEFFDIYFFSYHFYMTVCMYLFVCFCLVQMNIAIVQLVVSLFSFRLFFSLNMFVLLIGLKRHDPCQKLPLEQTSVFLRWNTKRKLFNETCQTLLTVITVVKITLWNLMLYFSRHSFR